jgi:hypothetical protein
MDSAQHGPVGIGDIVRVRATHATRDVRLAGLEGQVFGFTTPSITGIEVIGGPESDYALNVHFEELDSGHWFVPDLLELVEHGLLGEDTYEGEPGAGVVSRDSVGQDKVPKKQWWRFW